MSGFTNISFLVEPLESVFFGQPRSFNAGEAHRTNSVFPPSPFTFQGLVRSQLLRGASPVLNLDDWSTAARQERERLVGGPDALPAGWQLQGPFPARRVLQEDPDEEPWIEPWTPTPRFVLGEQRNPQLARLVQSPHPGLNDLDGAAQSLLPCGRPDAGTKVKPLEGWISPANLLAALTGQGAWQPKQHHRQHPPFVNWEYQPGLAIDSGSGSAEHGMLYFLNSLRFDRDSGLLGILQGALDPRLSLSALESATGSAGRKGRVVQFSGVERFHPAWETLMTGAHLPQAAEDNATFWLLALTPARLIEPLRLELNPPSGMRCELLAALTGRPVALGGYQMATGKSRANRLYVPAGSAWLLRFSGGTPADRAGFLQQLNNSHPLGPREEVAFGFGHTLVGLGPEQTKEIL